ncbi:hypothetical protein CC80DRAFT_497048 [Byssothecium circinans]|uniref:Uncharacterized protein n=1 Tax=Byssothecium circinans TaxID=147558 RepID=A0A6A5TCL5_9PLEO|nr:hypothetical protein CC80DRAFT_497048 [Byssothecium circinans]
MPDADCVSIHDYLSTHPNDKLGFVVYRLTYKDDAEWEKFMDHLNTVIRTKLEEYGDGDLFQHIDWSVQDDPSLQDLDSDQVRERFLKWIEQDAVATEDGHDVNPPWVAYPRHMACVAVYQIHVDHVMKDLNPSWSGQGEMGFVTLVSADRQEDDSEQEEDNFAEVNVSSIFPRMYSLLGALGWEGVWQN